MPLPTFTGLPPHADFDDVKKKVNKLTQELTNLMVNLDSLNVVSLTADHIDAGTINAGLVTIRADLTGGAFIQLDAATGMIINNGTINTFEADINGEVTATGITLINDLTGTGSIQIDNSGITVNDGAVDTFTVDIDGDVTMTSATIRSLATGERVELDSTGLHTYDAFGFERLTIGTAPVEGVKAITFRDTTGTAQSVLAYDTETVDGSSRTGQYITAHAAYMLLSDDGDVRIQNADGRGMRVVTGYPEVNDGFGWETVAIQSEVDLKADIGSSTSSNGAQSLNGGIIIGTTLATSSDGVTVDGNVTWNGISFAAHTHTLT